MYSEINKRLDFLTQGIARLHKVEAMIKQLESNQKNLEIKERELKKVFEQESLDVDKLKNGGIASAFLTIINKLEDRIEEERAEMTAAKQKYDQVVRELEDVNYRLSGLSSERLKYTGYQAEYDALIAQKKESLLRDNGEAAQIILELTEEICKLQIRSKQAQKAVAVGKDILLCLEELVQSVGSAQAWGKWFRGGVMADLNQHSNVYDANSQIERAHSLLLNFKTEISQINIDPEIFIDIDIFPNSSDFLFDGLMSDINVQKIIDNSTDRVVSMYKQVVDANRNLEKLAASDADNINKLDTELTLLVENA